MQEVNFHLYLGQGFQQFEGTPVVFESFSRPSGPVNANARALASATIAAAAVCSGDSYAGFRST